MKVRFIFQAVTLVLVTTFAISAQGRFEDIEYSVTDLGHGIYRLEATGGNIGLSIGEDGAFLIDGQYAPLTPKLLKAVGDLTDKPIKFLINTHWHGDHVGGNANIAATGTVVAAHNNVRSRMAAPGPKQYPEEALPAITFSDTTTWYINGLKIHAFHVEHAHTDGDAIIHIPEANIIHAGDILFNGLYPYIDLDSGGSVDGYIAAMEQLAELANEDTQIIAGHGPLGNKADVKRSIEMVKDAKTRVAALAEAGKTLEEVQEADPLADYHDDWAWRFITAEKMTAILYRDLTE
ncbi:MAG: MBL fold metallo-hydrolase [Puniceicoccaceae bacterium]